jgi:phospholipid/cholesterol/gamma-HCH transport system substrate-binding protein
MATAAQKTKVGVFLAACGVILAVGLLVVTGFHRAETKTYYVEFKGSVSGLNSGSSVQYLGVDVGKVEDVTVAEDNVRVKVAIRQDKGVRLREGTTAKLDMQGISGIVFVQLAPSVNEQASEMPEGSTIKSKETGIVERINGILDTFATSLPNLNSVLLNLNMVLTNLEQGNLKGELGATVSASKEMLITANKQISDLGAAVNKRIEDLGVTLKSIQATADSATEKVGQVNTAQISADIHEALTGMKELAAQLNKTAETLNKAVPAAQREMSLTQQELEITLADMRKTLQALEQLARTLEEDPSALVHGKSKRPE